MEFTVWTTQNSLDTYRLLLPLTAFYLGLTRMIAIRFPTNPGPFARDGPGRDT